MKQYIYREYKDCNAIEVECNYDLGGMSYFSGERRPRGIYVSISPVGKSQSTTSYQAFSGNTMCVYELKRSSPKILKHYEELISHNAEQLADWFVAGDKEIIHGWLSNLPKP